MAEYSNHFKKLKVVNAFKVFGVNAVNSINWYTENFRIFKYHPLFSGIRTFFQTRIPSDKDNHKFFLTIIVNHVLTVFSAALEYSIHTYKHKLNIHAILVIKNTYYARLFSISL